MKRSRAHYGGTSSQPDRWPRSYSRSAGRGIYKTRGKRVKRASTRALVSKISLHPYPQEYKTTITWCPPTALLIAAATNACFQVRVNDLYDPDQTNILGNGQALYTDQMMSATGPYQSYRVNSWKAEWHIQNVSSATSEGSAMALDLYLTQGAVSSTDTDTFAEVQNTPGVVTTLLGVPGTPQAYKVLNLNGRLADYVQSSIDANYNGAYNASPSNVIYMALAVKNGYPADAGTGVKIYVKLKMEFDVTFYARDAVTS